MRYKLLIFLLDILSSLKVLTNATKHIHYLALLILFSPSLYAQSEEPMKEYVVSIVVAIVVTAIGCHYLWLLWQNIKSKLSRKHALNNTKIMAELHKLSKDVVTQLPTQQQAIKAFKNEIRTQHNQKYAVIVFKPLNFTQLNQLLGCKNSDLLLIQLAYCIEQAVKNKNNLVNFETTLAPTRVARLPGLQFLVILNITPTVNEANVYIKELCRHISAAIPPAISIKNCSVSFELTFGIDYFNSQKNSINECIAWASDALLTAEQQQQPYCFYQHELNLFTQNNLIKMEQLKTAITTDNLIWQCQPQVDWLSKKVVGVELMVACQFSDDILTLEQFLTIAESSGDIHAIMQTMINKACLLAERLSHQFSHIPITITLASQQLLDDTLIDLIENKLQQHQLSNTALLIALPETLMNLDTHKVNRFIDLLHESQLNFAIDQFSGSYEALRYLRKVSVHQIKLDCLPLTELAIASTDKAIIHTVIQLAKMMNIALIGVNINQLSSIETFQEMGGNIVQGKAIARNVAFDDIINWLNAWKKQHTLTNVI